MNHVPYPELNARGSEASYGDDRLLHLEVRDLAPPVDLAPAKQLPQP